MARSRLTPRLVARAVWRRLPRAWWKRIGIVVGAAGAVFLGSVNVAVAFVGDTLVFPFSPWFLDEKLHALGAYARHRPLCLLTGHESVELIAREAAVRRGVEPALLVALVTVESGLRPHRISPTGAMGAAQLMPSTARMLGVRDPFDPEQGVDGGARYLKEQLVRFRGDVRLAVAAYNAGPGAIHDGQVPRNGETEYYVPRVLARWRELRPPPPPTPPPAPVHAVRVAQAPPPKPEKRERAAPPPPKKRLSGPQR